ncbi:MAG: hypothetical protein HYX75_18170 [Acidobacteria bacterium]|nr:hypothetical protein [Acidobacteriota bacterium]
MSDLTLFLQHLKQPEYIHVLLNPLPVYGLAMGMLGLLLGLIKRNRHAQMLALTLVFIGSAVAFPVLKTGERAYDRVEAMSAPDARGWLEVHQQRAEKVVYVYYASALLAAVALLVQWRSWKGARALTLITFVLGAAAMAGGGWISQAGGQVRHSEFRDGPPAASAMDADDHE